MTPPQPSPFERAQNRPQLQADRDRAGARHDVVRNQDAGHDGRGSPARYVLQLSTAVENLWNELREELLADLRAEQGVPTWPGWMSVDTASRYLDCPVERVRKLVARREIPFAQEGPGCRIFFNRSDLDRWMSGFQQAARGGGT
jgi:excisionase family DNA binding protein